MSGRSVSRRDAAAGGLAMLVLAAAAAGQAKAQELDGELLAISQEFHENRIEIDAIWDDEMPEDGTPEARRSSILIDRYEEIRERLAELPARTPEGIRAKARVILAEFVGEDGKEYPNSHDPRGALALSLARDVLGSAS
jgi:hypothetical protein